MPKTIQVESKVIAIAEESNDMYMSLSMVFLTSAVNLNNIQFTEDFINGIATNSDKYVGIPLVADISNLENGQYSKLTHKQNKKTGTFGTVGIGSFVKFYTRQTGGTLELLADARVWKRNPKTCDALEELYGSDEGLKFSYEVLVGNSTEENGITIVSEDENNNPIGSCVVSFPAVPASKCELMVAELFDSDNLNILEGGKKVAKLKRDNTITCEQAFAETKIHTTTEVAELDNSQINRKIWNALKIMFPNDYWDWDVTDRYPTYIVIQNWDTGDYFQIDFAVTDSDVVLSEKVPVYKTYVKTIKDDEGGNDMTLAEAQAKLEAAEANLKAKEVELASKTKEVEGKDTEIKTKETELIEKTKQMETLSASVLEKDNKVKELEPIKVSYDTLMAEKTENEAKIKRAELKDKFSKLLSAEILATAEMTEAIEKLDESKLNAKVVEIAMATATKTEPKGKTVQTASRITDTVKIVGSENSTSLKEKYSI